MIQLNKKYEIGLGKTIEALSFAHELPSGWKAYNCQVIRSNGISKGIYFDHHIIVLIKRWNQNTNEGKTLTRAANHQEKKQ